MNIKVKGTSHRIIQKWTLRSCTCTALQRWTCLNILDLNWVGSCHQWWGKFHYRWALLVLHYPGNMVIYHYSLVGVIFMVLLHVIIIKITLNSSQIISLNTNFGSFPPLYAFTRIYMQIHFPLTLPDCGIGNRNVLIFLESCFW